MSLGNRESSSTSATARSGFVWDACSAVERREGSLCMPPPFLAAHNEEKDALVLCSQHHTHPSLHPSTTSIPPRTHNIECTGANHGISLLLRPAGDQDPGDRLPGRLPHAALQVRERAMVCGICTCWYVLVLVQLRTWGYCIFFLSARGLYVMQSTIKSYIYLLNPPIDPQQRKQTNQPHDSAREPGAPRPTATTTGFLGRYVLRCGGP